mmetsp:Transcript_9948/g.11277  ORF Transcript_9948/g.11277 Transcript_9948/m.11277 type:complete len:216 (+) Transcript_9948:89-736(+)
MVVRRFAEASHGNLEAVDPVGGSHRRLDVQALDLHPALGQQAREEVDGKGDVRHHILLVHLNVANSNTQAQGFLALQLELHRRGGVEGDDRDISVGTQRTGEFARLVEARTQKTRDLSNKGRRRKESVVLLGKLLHKLLVLLQLLEVVHAHGRNTSLRAVGNVLGVSQHAHIEGFAWRQRQADGARESPLFFPDKKKHEQIERGSASGGGPEHLG